MFPHACGRELAEAVRLGADPKAVVPDNYLVIRGGTKPPSPAGMSFSATVGPNLEAAACAVPHGQIRTSKASEIRRLGGMVEWKAEFSPHGTLNQQHVNVIEGPISSFSSLVVNPVPKNERIDGSK